MGLTPYAGYISADGQTCFYCGEPTSDPAVYWMGGADIFLHVACAMELCLRIMRDVHEWECQYHSEMRPRKKARPESQFPDFPEMMFRMSRYLEQKRAEQHPPAPAPAPAGRPEGL